MTYRAFEMADLRSGSANPQPPIVRAAYPQRQSQSGRSSRTSRFTTTRGGKHQMRSDRPCWIFQHASSRCRRECVAQKFQFDGNGNLQPGFWYLARVWTYRPTIYNHRFGIKEDAPCLRCLGCTGRRQNDLIDALAAKIRYL
jgi:hypothetical protein